MELCLLPSPCLLQSVRQPIQLQSLITNPTFITQGLPHITLTFCLPHPSLPLCCVQLQLLPSQVLQHVQRYSHMASLLQPCLSFDLAPELLQPLLLQTQLDMVQQSSALQGHAAALMTVVAEWCV